MTTRTVFITGVSAGVGKACAKLFLNEGHRVIGMARRRARLDELLSEYSAKAFHPLTCDVNDSAEIARQLESMPPGFRDIDVLVNNAGILRGGTDLLGSDRADLLEMLQTNCSAVIEVTRLLLPSLMRSGSGHLVTISSVASKYVYPTGHVYAATKAFVEHFTNSLRTEIASAGVKITNIRPGQIQTEFFDRLNQQSAAGRIRLDAEDVAQAVHWAVTQPARVCVNEIELIPAGHALSYR